LPSVDSSNAFFHEHYYSAATSQVAAQLSPFYGQNNSKLFAVESVYAAIEVKTNLGLQPRIKEFF
jgi:hypothetical protein